MPRARRIVRLDATSFGPKLLWILAATPYITIRRRNDRYRRGCDAQHRIFRLPQTVFKLHKAGGVAARPGQMRDQARPMSGHAVAAPPRSVMELAPLNVLTRLVQ
jgi:hypothetical protein